MKKGIAIVLLSAILFSILGYALLVYAEEGLALDCSLKRETVPEIMNYENAVFHGHIQRVYDEEHSLNSVVFRNIDGTNTLYLFNEDVKYVDDRGKIIDKSNKLVELENGTITNEQNDVLVAYSCYAGDGVTLTYNGFYFVSTPLIESEASRRNMSQKAVTYHNQQLSQIIYKNCFSDKIDLRYTQTFSGYKEEIILYEQKDKNCFSFSIETNGILKIDENDEIVAFFGGNEIGRFGNIVILDACKKMIDGYLTLEEISTHNYIITVSAPDDFLKSKGTQYPILIDPSFNVTTSASNKTIEDATIFTDYSTNFGTWFTLFIGNYDAWFPTAPTQRGIARALVRFPGLFSNSWFNAYYKAGRVNSIKMNFSDTDCGQTNTIRAYRFTKAWDESTVVYSSTLWNGYTTSNAGGSVTITEQTLTNPLPRYEIDVTNIVNYQMSYPSTQGYGLMLKATNESLPSVVIGSSEAGDSIGLSSSKPYLTINYTPMPSTETSGIISGGIYQIINSTSGKALSCSGATLSQQVASPASTSQQFKISYNSSGKYEITPMSNTNYRIGTDGSTWTVGTSTGSMRQLWHLLRTSSGFIHVHSSYSTNKLLIAKNSSTNVYVDNSTLGSDWTFKFICLDVPLLAQQATDTCGSACGIMALRFYGITNVTESQFKAQAGIQFSYAYAVTNALNYYLTSAGVSIQYHFIYSSTFSESSFLSAINNNIFNNHPVLIQLKIGDQTYFPYTTNGHYVLIVGLFYDSGSGEYMAVINDPHYNYCAQRIVPLSTILQYAKAHGGCAICVD